MAKKKKIKFNNQYKIPNDKADEIRKLNNDELIARVALEYRNWEAVDKQKKNDPAIQIAKESVERFKSEITNDPEYKTLEEEFKAKKEEFITEDLARSEEELKNLNQPYNEDIKLFRGMFKVAMDELNERRDKGIIVLKDKI